MRHTSLQMPHKIGVFYVFAKYTPIPHQQLLFSIYQILLNRYKTKSANPSIRAEFAELFLYN